jgi:hypothetical protein
MSTALPTKGCAPRTGLGDAGGKVGCSALEDGQGGLHHGGGEVLLHPLPHQLRLRALRLGCWGRRRLVPRLWDTTAEPDRSARAGRGRWGLLGRVSGWGLQGKDEGGTQRMHRRQRRPMYGFLVNTLWVAAVEARLKESRLSSTGGCRMSYLGHEFEEGGAQDGELLPQQRDDEQPRVVR